MDTQSKMPMYEFIVLDEQGNKTKEIIEEIFKHTEVPDVLVSSNGRTAVRNKVNLIARTHTSWGDTYSYYDPGLMQHVNSRKEADKIAEKRGLVPIDDLPKHTFMDMLEKKQKQNKFWDEQIELCDELVKKHGEIEGNILWQENKKLKESEQWLPTKFKNLKVDTETINNIIGEKNNG